MGLDTSSAASPIAISRLAGVGLIVFLANAALLVLQLVAGRLLAPFIGSSLETWTSVIGVFLVGIALGNGFGGKLADRYPTPRTLSALLGIGAIAAVWMAIFPLFLAESGIYKSIPLGPRIPALALVLCLPASFVLSLLTPLAIKLGLPDLSKAGRVAGMVFALGTLGCLLGNYLTGFILIPSFMINTLVFFSTGTLAALSIGSFLLMGGQPAGPVLAPAEKRNSSQQVPFSGQPPTETAIPEQTNINNDGSTNPYAFGNIRLAFVIVFLASFGGMTMELTASRVLAEFLGVSLFTWTGIIGVMLAGTALGNVTGGLIADRASSSRSTINPRYLLAGSLLLAGAGVVFQFAVKALISRYELFRLRSHFAGDLLDVLPLFPADVCPGYDIAAGDPPGGSGCCPYRPGGGTGVCLEHDGGDCGDVYGRVPPALEHGDEQNHSVRCADLDDDESAGGEYLGL
jgi:MFS family permease